MDALLNALTEKLENTVKDVKLYVATGARWRWDEAAKEINDAYVMIQRIVLMLDDVVAIGHINPRYQLEKLNDRISQHQFAIRTEKIIVGDLLEDLDTTLRSLSAFKVFLHGTEIHPLPGRTFQSVWP